MTAYEVTVPFLHFVRVEASSPDEAAQLAWDGGGDLNDEEKDTSVGPHELEVVESEDQGDEE